MLVLAAVLAEVLVQGPVLALLVLVPVVVLVVASVVWILVEVLPGLLGLALRNLHAHSQSVQVVQETRSRR